MCGYPFVALPIFVSLDNLDRSLLEAASDLGSSRWRAFLRITLPLSLPGVLAAFLFVFVPTIGEFVTPLLVGGTSGYLFGNAIQDLFTRGLDWQTGSVLALFLLAVVAGIMALLGRFIQVRAWPTDGDRDLEERVALVQAYSSRCSSSSSTCRSCSSRCSRSTTAT